MPLSGTGLTYGFGARRVIDDVHVAISVGEAVAIVGPSGVGKTTVLSLLGGLLRPQSGRVEADGRHHPGDYVAWVLQTVNVLPSRTVVDNVALAPLADGTSWREAHRVATTRLVEVGLADVAGAPARTLSGGELQRAVIARALASNRPYLLADEPTGQLDHTTTHTVLACLLAARTERGILIVTHDESVAARCDRVLRLIDGRLHPDGTNR